MGTHEFKPAAPTAAGAAINTGLSINNRVLAADDTTQLTKLSSVLNGLESGACIMRRHVQQARVAFRAGTYQVDPRMLSRRIISEASGRSEP